MCVGIADVNPFGPTFALADVSTSAGAILLNKNREQSVKLYKNFTLPLHTRFEITDTGNRMPEYQCPSCGSTSGIETVLTAGDSLWLTCDKCKNVWDVPLREKQEPARPPDGDLFSALYRRQI